MPPWTSLGLPGSTQLPPWNDLGPPLNLPGSTWMLPWTSLGRLGCPPGPQWEIQRLACLLACYAMLCYAMFDRRPGSSLGLPGSTWMLPWISPGRHGCLPGSPWPSWIDLGVPLDLPGSAWGCPPDLPGSTWVPPRISLGTHPCPLHTPLASPRVFWISGGSGGCSGNRGSDAIKGKGRSPPFRSLGV